MEKLSYISQPRSLPYVYQTIPNQVQKWAEECPDKTAFIYRGSGGIRKTITCSQLYRSSKKLAEQLTALGLQKGDNVGMCLPNSIDHVIGDFGILLAGGVVVKLAMMVADGRDVKDILTSMRCCFLFVDQTEQGVWEILRPMARDLGIVMICTNMTSSDREDNVVPLEELLCVSLEESVLLPTVLPEDIAVVFTSSGSTGKPKLIAVTHFFVLNNYFDFRLRTDEIEKDVCYLDRPMSWLGGFPGMYIMVGVTTVFIDSKVTTSEDYAPLLCKILMEESVTIAGVMPYVLTALMDTECFAKLPDWKPVKTVFMGGQRFLKAYTALIGSFCQTLVTGYGSTEMGIITVFSSSNPDDFQDGICGSLHNGAEVKIVDDDGQILSVNQVGEICLRKVYAFLQYVGDERATMNARDPYTGWIRLGDLGKITEDGTLFFESRTSDTISYGTRKIYPGAIEDVISHCPNVDCVFVVPVPDETLGEAICACVLPKPGVHFPVESLQKYCEDNFPKETALDGLGCRPTHYLILDEVPLTPSGKHSRKELRNMATLLLGLDV